MVSAVARAHVMMRNLIISLLLVAVSSTAMAQDPLTWTVAPANGVKSIPAGSIALIELTGKIEPGWHIYSLTQGPGGPVPTRIILPAEQPFALSGTIKSSPPDFKFDENFKIDVEYYEREAAFTVPVKVEEAAKPGTHDLSISVRYQACTTTICLPARTEKLKLPLTIESARREE